MTARIWAPRSHNLHPNSAQMQLSVTVSLANEQHLAGGVPYACPAVAAAGRRRRRWVQPPSPERAARSNRSHRRCKSGRAVSHAVPRRIGAGKNRAAVLTALEGAAGALNKSFNSYDAIEAALKGKAPLPAAPCRRAFECGQGESLASRCAARSIQACDVSNQPAAATQAGPCRRPAARRQPNAGPGPALRHQLSELVSTDT